MAVRTLLVLVAFAVLYGCGQASSPVERQEKQAGAYAIKDYSFPSIEVDGDHATIERVYDWATPDDFGQDKATQEMVLEDEGWRVLMRQEQYEFYLGGEETTQ